MNSNLSPECLADTQEPSLGAVLLWAAVLIGVGGAGAFALVTLWEQSLF